MRFIQLSFMLLAFSLLTACGGGGDGGSGDGGSANSESARVSISTTPFSSQWEVGAAVAPSAKIKFTATGTTSTGVYLSWVDPQNQISSVTTGLTTDTEGYFLVTPKSWLAEGSYNGTLTINVCRDSACARHYPGSPATINYTLKVQPTLQFSTKNLTINTTVGQKASGVIKVTRPANITSYTAMTGLYSDWLTWTGDMATDTFTVTSKALPAGHYSDSILFSTGAQTIRINVTINVVAAAATDINKSADQNNIESSHYTSPDSQINTASAVAEQVNDPLAIHFITAPDRLFKK